MLSRVKHFVVEHAIIKAKWRHQNQCATGFEKSFTLGNKSGAVRNVLEYVQADKTIDSG